MSYDSKFDRFVMKPAGSDNYYSFGRKKLTGSEGSFYCCDVKSMIGKEPTSYPEPATTIGARHRVLVQTVAENMRLYSRRKTSRKREKRET